MRCQDRKGTVKAVFDTAATVSVVSTLVAETLNLKAKDSVVIQTLNGRKEFPKTQAVRIEVFGSVVELPVVVADMEYGLLLGLDWVARTGACIDPSMRRLIFPMRTITLDNNKEVVESSSRQEQEIFLTEVEGLGMVEPNVEEDMTWNFEQGDMPRAHQSELVGHEDANRINAILEEYRTCFCEDIMDLGNPSINPIEIYLKSERPIYKPPFRRSRREVEALKREVDKMLEAKIIRASKSAYGAPAFSVGKPDKSIRVVVDYRGVNAMMDDDRFPMPRVDDILDRLGGDKVFSVLDCKAGYWQLPLAETAIPKTAFTTPFGHFEFLRLPFGLKNAPAEFNRVMKGVLGHLDFAEVYLDDIIIHSGTASEHREHLKEVLETLKRVGLKLNPKKAQIAVDTVKVLGHIVSGGQVMPNDEKVEAVRRWKHHQN